jgi:hypothetical protein
MEAPEETSESLDTPHPQAMEIRREVTWNDIGDAFETMGKVGLAMAIGMSAAGLFCRLAEQGKVRVPTLTGLLVNRPEPKSSDKKRSRTSS